MLKQNNMKKVKFNMLCELALHKNNENICQVAVVFVTQELFVPVLYDWQGRN